MNIEDLQSTGRIADYFLNNLNELSKISVTESRDILQLASQVVVHCQDTELRNKCMNLLYYCCFYFNGLDLKELCNIYWILTAVLFDNYNSIITGNLDELYKLIYERVEKSITDEYKRTDNSGSNLVVIATNQFLGLNHAPTRRVLDYAYTIATALNKKVFIVNGADFYFYPCKCIEQYIAPQYDYNLNNFGAVAYKGLNIPFMQFRGYMPELYGINEMLREIYRLQPELVYNIGSPCLISDLCKLFTKTVCQPCSNNIPVSMSEFLLVGRKLNNGDEKRLKRLEPYQKVMETITNYELPEAVLEYKRSDFGIQEDAFVLGIVGNRLDKEILDEFIQVMDDILNQQDVHFIIIGKVKEPERIKNRITKNEKIHFTGEVQEASQVIKLCDIYCNPKRNGGGRSSFEALSHRVPVITLRYGDVYYTCGEDFAVDTYGEYLERIKRYIIDKEYYQVARDNALKRANILSDLAGTQREIINKIL